MSGVNKKVVHYHIRVILSTEGNILKNPTDNFTLNPFSACDTLSMFQKIGGARREFLIAPCKRKKDRRPYDSIWKNIRSSD